MLADTPTYALTRASRGGGAGGPAEPAPLRPGSNRAVRAQQRAAALRRRRRLEKVLPWLIIVAFFALWEIFVRAFGIAEFVLPAPSTVAASAIRWWQPLMLNAGQTLLTTSIGFALAVVLGMLMGVAFGSSTLIYRGVYPLLIAFNSVPKVAVVPVLVLWFGINAIPAIITAFAISFFPIVVNVATGIATIEPEQRDVLRALGARTIEIVRKVGVPRAMPYFFASLKIAITVAFVGSITAETVSSETGIGHLMMVASSRFDVALVFAGLMVTGVMGIAMYAVAAVIEARMTTWATRGQNDLQNGGY
ncbi:ABC transporter permease [Pigmentiphaga soli]|uniref:ABC transporter permease n=1 Tax=Pigmentiphaga soli TaxID=1007095 RepID=A0ABP8HHV8_9BURK